MIIGITGSIGSGKTTIARIFSRYHFKRIDADEIGHRIIKKNSGAYKKIIKEFGNGILGKNKDIDRNRLGNFVFNDGGRLKRLNSITHPIIISAIRNQIKKIQKKCGKKTKIIVDAPLLLETETRNIVDKIIVVKCDKSNILKRGNKYPKDKIERILKLQMPIKEKLRHADFVIDNNKGLGHLEMQIKKIIKGLDKK
ncbi:dephospho-CoA kinase [Candidatus Woesearchaeota archaeon]|nr:dephospho-CoA kinase [Candidatus Woesearchaeota archaeon]